MANGPTVAFLAGAGRSGSTLVERMLGEIRGFVNVGELIDLFRRVYHGDELCGCGKQFSRCDFWQAVGEKAFDGWNSQVVRDVARLQGAVARQRYIPLHLGLFRGTGFRCSVMEYQKVYAALYQAIAETAGAEVVVDASKWPAQAMALARGEIDLRVVNVVRDIRGVAWSMSKRDVVRPHATRGTDLMFNRGMYVAAVEWSLCQGEVKALRQLRVPVATIKYERLANSAKSEIGRALAALSIDVEDANLGHLREGEADLGMSHGLSGNPSRFAGGTTHLRTDEVWREEMPRRKQMLIAGVGLPHRLRSPSASRMMAGLNDLRRS